MIDEAMLITIMLKAELTNERVPTSMILLKIIIGFMMVMMMMMMMMTIIGLMSVCPLPGRSPLCRPSQR